MHNVCIINVIMYNIKRQNIIIKYNRDPDIRITNSYTPT